MDIHADLNPAQKQAVMTTSGPVLILAGAGSGKTKALTHRIAHLIDSEGVWPNEILAVTFTNKAAKEMRERLGHLLGQDGSSRSFMPWMGTFHSICVRLLRIDGAAIGVPPNFVVYDESDRQGLIKQAMKQLSVTDKQIKASAVSAAISNAKNQLLAPEDYEATAQYPFQQKVAEIYAHYEQLRREAGALDFDDLLTEAVVLLRDHPDIRGKWRAQFKHILIDEYQDTNAAQYAIVKSLVGEERNICVVGDDWQCFPGGSLVDTPSGVMPIETIRTGDKVISAAGYGRTTTGTVQRLRKVSFEGDLVRVTTKSGKTFQSTPKHIVFGRMAVTDKYFVYLMYAPAKGYRIGIAKGTRSSGKKHEVGLRVRANQERAAKMWVLRVCDTRSEAQFNEARLSFMYGIPMTVFSAALNRNMSMTQEQIDMIYKDIDTRERVKQLMADEELSYEYPHFVPQATTRGGRDSSVFNIVLFGDRRTSATTPWSASRLSIHTSSPAVIENLKSQNVAMRTGKNGSLRAEWHNIDYGAIEQRSADIAVPGTVAVMRYAFMTNEKYTFMPASQLREGMEVPVLEGDSIRDDMIVGIERVPYKGVAYDLDIDKIHNYSVGGIVSHNSIYSWRGADFTNILNFERDFPGAKVIKLEQNYRSTSAILEAAQNVISKNTNRTDKKLWTDEPGGMPVQVHPVYDEAEEAHLVASRIGTQVMMGARRHGDYAVLYRTNAQSFSLERAFLQQRIPYQIIGGVRFYDRKEVKDIIAYLRLLYQPSDRMSFSRIVNVPTRGIGETSLEKFLLWQASTDFDIVTALMNIEQASGLTPRARTALARLGEVIRGLQAKIMSDAPPSEIIEALIEKTGYRDFILDGTPQAEEREANLSTLVSDAKNYVTLPDFLEEAALMSSVDTAEDTEKVTLMTMHAAKGLEFPVVFMVGMEEGLMPSSRALEAGKAELEEERRLCYVGMTRAREELHLSYASSRMQFGQRGYNMPSRFLGDMGHEIVQAAPSFERQTQEDEWSELPDFDIGDRVRSNQFGQGEIIDVDGLAVTVAFSSGQTKKLNVEYARLEKL